MFELNKFCPCKIWKFTPSPYCFLICWKKSTSESELFFIHPCMLQKFFLSIVKPCTILKIKLKILSINCTAPKDEIFEFWASSPSMCSTLFQASSSVLNMGFPTCSILPTSFHLPLEFPTKSLTHAPLPSLGEVSLSFVYPFFL